VQEQAQVNTKTLVSAFAASITRGAPAAAAVAALARRNRTSESVIWNRLFAAGAVNRRRISGAFVYWPAIDIVDQSSPRRVSVDSVRAAAWQELIGWALLSGFCTSDQITALRTDKDFFDFFGPFLARELGWKVQSGWSQRKVNDFLRPAIRNRAA